MNSQNIYEVFFIGAVDHWLIELITILNTNPYIFRTYLFSFIQL